MKARIDSKITLDVTGIDPMLRAQICASLTMKNPGKERAQAELVRGAEHMPDELDLWDVDGNDLIFPRGFAHKLEAIAAQRGESIEWDNQMTLLPPSEHVLRDWKPVELRDYQMLARDAMLDWAQGLFSAPTGCLGGDSEINLSRAGKGFKLSIEDLYCSFNEIPYPEPRVSKDGRRWCRPAKWRDDIPTLVRALDRGGELHLWPIRNVFYSGIKSVLELRLHSGKALRCTPDHRIATPMGWIEAGRLQSGDHVLANGRFLDKDGYAWITVPNTWKDHPRVHHDGKGGYAIREHHVVMEQKLGRPVQKGEIVHHINRVKDDNRPENLELCGSDAEHMAHHFENQRQLHGAISGRGGEVVVFPHEDYIETIQDAGCQKTYDIEMAGPKNFVANGIIVHNSGKTRCLLEFARWAGQRTLIIVGKTALARQWQEAVRDLYGCETGYIGEAEWDEQDFTIGLWQTLNARRMDLEASAESWGCVVLDEAHHSSASTIAEIMGQFPAFYRIGATATPKWDPLLFPIIEAVIGPVIHKTTHQEVGDDLVLPTVRFVKSDFSAEYQATKMDGRERIQNNFAEIMAALVRDSERNDLIADIASREAGEGHHVLIVTRRIEHVKQIVRRLEHDFKIGTELHTLTGSQTGHDAQRISRAIEKAERTILISTVAEEALNFPRLDRIILAFPLRKTPLIEQQVGRILRPAPSKSEAIVYDVVDDGVGPLKSQRRERAQMYSRRGWKTETLEREETSCL